MVGTRRYLSVRLMAAGFAIALAATTLPVVAQGQDLTGVVVDFPDPVPTEILDLSGNVIGQGEHEGTVRCFDGNCGQRTELGVTSIPAVYEYKFKDLQALDVVTEVAVVAGTGVKSGEDGKERFSFTAIFLNNGDGTVAVRYVASIPDASFVLPAAPGTFTLVQRP